jgi:hypothetical protein
MVTLFRARADTTTVFGMKERRFLPIGLVAGAAVGVVAAALTGTEWHLILIGVAVGGIVDLLRFFVGRAGPGGAGPAQPYYGGEEGVPPHYGGSHDGGFDGDGGGGGSGSD